MKNDPNIPERVASPVSQDDLAYWKRQLAGAPLLLEIATDRPRPAIRTQNLASQSIVLSQPLTEKLSALSRSENVTLFFLLTAAFQALLSRYSGQEDIVTGGWAPNLNRVALRTDLSGNPTFRELLTRVKQVSLDAQAHENISFETLIDELGIERSSSYHPIFQTMFGIESRSEREAKPNPAVDISWVAIEGPDGLLLELEYSRDLFDDATIARQLGHYRNLLIAIVADPECRLSSLPLLGEEERRLIQTEFNNTFVESPNLCVHDFLARQAAQTPDAVALVSGYQRITYRELNEKANQIAHFLTARGAGPDVLIGIYAERTADMVAGILGILKAGSAYVPLDPKYPKQRLAHILEDAQAPIVLTQESLRADLPNFAGAVICLDRDWPSMARESREDPVTNVRPEHLAYVLFTSGSTGRPKGVALEHHSAVTFISGVNRIFSRDELSGVLFCTSICFDMSTFEMFATIAAGGKMILAESPLHLPMLPARSEVTLINTVPSAIAELVRGKNLPPSVTTLALAGEALADALVDEIYESTGVAKVYNLYGPTESGYSTYTLVPRGAPVTIGRPMDNIQAYVLDPHLNLAPVGVPGELYLAGEGLARGYYGRPDLTNERFIPNPFGPGAPLSNCEQGTRMYRTGDLCRWLPDGNLDYLGRIDHQVKLHGFRVELGEIEATLNRHPGVRQSVVIASETEPGLKRLVAYVVPKNGTRPGAQELQEHVRRSLPEFMAPSVVMLLDAFPLTPNGKVDRKALPAPKTTDLEADQDFVAPRDPIERKLAALWEEVLGVHPVGVKTSFFDLGGQSLQAARLFTTISSSLGKDLPFTLLFQAPTIEQLAKHLQPDSQGKPKHLVPIQPRGWLPAFFCVHGGGGSTLFLRDLAENLGLDQPLYGLDSEGFDGKPFQLLSIEDMAAHYLSEIRQVQPAGPYYLGGYCLGTLVAFEMAQQLRSQGEDVGALVLFAPSARFPQFASKPPVAKHASTKPTSARFQLLLQSPWLVVRRRIAWHSMRMKMRSQMFMNQLFARLRLTVPVALRWLHVTATLERIGDGYKPKPYSGTVILFRGRGVAVSDPDRGWRRLAANLEDHVMGDTALSSRRDIMREPLVGRVAAELAICLQRARTVPAGAEASVPFGEPLTGPVTAPITMVRSN